MAASHGFEAEYAANRSRLSVFAIAANGPRGWSGTMTATPHFPDRFCAAPKTSAPKAGETVLTRNGRTQAVPALSRAYPVLFDETHFPLPWIGTSVGHQR